MTAQRSECKVNGCDKPVVNGWGHKPHLCSKHYFLQYGKRHGICSVDGCNEVIYARGVCSRHYHRLLHNWSPEELKKPFQKTMSHRGELCAVAGCERKATKGALCEFHYTRKRRGVPFDKPYENHGSHKFRVNGVSYKNVHERLRQHRGPAAAFACVDCGRQARDWSYQYGAPDEQADPDTGYLFSADMSYYVPRCRSCNLSFDYLHRQKTRQQTLDLGGAA